MGFTYEASLIALARWADFLVISSAGGLKTWHLVSADVIAALGPEGFLINVARGSVIDEAALVDALVNKNRRRHKPCQRSTMLCCRISPAELMKQERRRLI